MSCDTLKIITYDLVFVVYHISIYVSLIDNERLNICLGCRRVEGDEENVEDDFEDEIHLKNQFSDHQRSVINSHLCFNQCVFYFIFCRNKLMIYLFVKFFLITCTSILRDPLFSFMCTNIYQIIIFINFFNVKRKNNLL